MNAKGEEGGCGGTEAELRVKAAGRREGEAERECWNNESEGEAIIGLKHFLHLV